MVVNLFLLILWLMTKCCCACVFLQVLAHLLDMVFYSDEKERVIPLLVNIMHYVVPYLRNHRWSSTFKFFSEMISELNLQLQFTT